MGTLAGERRRNGSRALGVLLLVAGMLAMPRAAAAGDGPWWWPFDWVWRLWSADAPPTPPLLGMQDRDGILKMELMLAEHDRANPSAVNRMMLGLLASAKGNAAEATGHLRRAAELDKGSIALQTLVAQTLLQEGHVEQAVRKHEAIILILRERPTTPLLVANAHLDLAVAYVAFAEKAGERRGRKPREAAHRQMELALEALDGAERKTPAVALGYLQAGVVYDDVLGDRQQAVDAWQQGVAAAKEARGEAGRRMALLLNLRLAQAEPDRARSHLDAAYQAVQALPTLRENRDHFESSVQTHVQLGEAYAAYARQQEKVTDDVAERLTDVQQAVDMTLEGDSPYAERLRKTPVAQRPPIYHQALRFDYDNTQLKAKRLRQDKGAPEARLKEIEGEIETLQDKLLEPWIQAIEKVTPEKLEGRLDPRVLERRRRRPPPR